MKSTFEKVQEIKRYGYPFDFGAILSQIFENYKKIALLSGGVFLLLALFLVIGFTGIGAVLGMAIGFTDYFSDLAVGQISVTTHLIHLAITVVIYGLMAPVAAGIIQIAHNAETNKEYDFSTAFVHYKTKYFKDLFLGTAFIILITSGMSTVLEISKLYFYDTPFILILMIISMVFSVAVSILTLLTMPYIIFGDLNAMEAIKASIATTSKHFWMILLLMILIGICAMLGLFALCIGIFFTMPLYLSTQYILYRNAIPVEEKDELDEIGSSEY
jgi:uncharacterized membrane protein YesL